VTANYRALVAPALTNHKHRRLHACRHSKPTQQHQNTEELSNSNRRLSSSAENRLQSHLSASHVLPQPVELAISPPTAQRSVLAASSLVLCPQPSRSTVRRNAHQARHSTRQHQMCSARDKCLFGSDGADSHKCVGFLSSSHIHFLIASRKIFEKFLGPWQGY